MSEKETDREAEVVGQENDVLSRRQFTVLGAAAALGSYSNTVNANNIVKGTASMRHEKCTSIDVHAHFMPPASAPAGTAAEGFKAPVFSSWSPQQAIAFMDAHDIDVQMLSHPLAISAKEVREHNEYGASIVQERPDRFGLLAALPLHDVQASLEEIKHSFEVLKADGIALVTNYEGKYLGDARFDPIWEALEQRRATVFIHPCSPACFECVGLGRPGPVLEFPLDTTRTAVDMLFAGVFDRFPNINFILAHSGGALATLAHRVATILEMPFCPNPRGLTTETALKALSTVYFECALASHNGALGPVVELAGTDKILFGTDYPAAPPPVVAKNIALLKAFPGLNETSLKQISRTAAGLFPRFLA
ncbi:amidohydrolase family protein [Sphingomonas bisphenolicum]